MCARTAPRRGAISRYTASGGNIDSVARLGVDLPKFGEITRMQTVTFMDPAGNVAQYTVYDANGRGEHRWSTDHGDSGSESSNAQAQIAARTVLKASMAVRRRTDLTDRYRSVEKRPQAPKRRLY